jgi:hypothetical protein
LKIRLDARRDIFLHSISKTYSSTGMVSLVYPPELFPGDMGVDLGRGDLTVAEHELDRPEVSAAF